MATRTKIKIQDCAELREQLDALYDKMPQVILAQWSLDLAKHILELAGIDYRNNQIIQDGFKINEAWQKGAARVHDVRQEGFKVHQLAKKNNNETVKTALRVTQAIGTGHMREHAMVASDYAIKFVNLTHPNNEAAVIAERQWQINQLNQYVK